MNKISVREAMSLHLRGYKINPGDYVVVHTEGPRRNIAFVSSSVRTFGYANLMSMDDDKEIFEVVADSRS